MDRWRRPGMLVAGVAIAALLSGLAARRPPSAQGRWQPIYQGIWLQRLEAAALPGHGQGGLAHVVRIDMQQPGVELVLSPSSELTDPMYRANYPWAVAARNRWAVAINGPHFSAEHALKGPLPQMTQVGSPCRPVYPVTLGQPRTTEPPRRFWLFYQDRDGRLGVAPSNAPMWDEGDPVRFAVGEGTTVFQDGEPKTYWINNVGQEGPTRRTAIGHGPHGRFLYLAVLQRGTYGTMAATLAELGASQAIMLDGGGSTCMALGPDAANAPQRIFVGGHEPVAASIGVRARPLGSTP